MTLKLRREKEVVPIFHGKKVSSTMTIPIEMARLYGFDKEPSHAVLEAKEEGILIRKLEI
jgi:hypothetical protein